MKVLNQVSARDSFSLLLILLVLITNTIPDLWQRCASEHTPHFDTLASVGHIILPRHILLHWLVLVLKASTGSRLDNLK